MEAQAQLAKCQAEDFWRPLTAERIAFLRHAIQPLFRVISQADFKAMRFEKEVLEASLAHLKGEKEKYAALTENLVAQIGELPLSVNIVAQETGLIQKAQTNHYWATMTDQGFDHLAAQLAPLMHFRDGRDNGTGPAKFNFADVLTSKEYIEFGPEHESLSVAQYRKLVEEKINELIASNPILQKIRDAQPVSDEEAETLAVSFTDEHPHIRSSSCAESTNIGRQRFFDLSATFWESKFSKAFRTQFHARLTSSSLNIPCSPATSFSSSTSFVTT